MLLSLYKYYCMYMIYQLEEDYSEIQKLLAQERSARIQQENIFNNCLRKQQETEEENKQNISKSNEVIVVICHNCLSFENMI